MLHFNFYTIHKLYFDHIFVHMISVSIQDFVEFVSANIFQNINVLKFSSNGYRDINGQLRALATVQVKMERHFRKSGSTFHWSIENR